MHPCSKLLDKGGEVIPRCTHDELLLSWERGLDARLPNDVLLELLHDIVRHNFDRIATYEMCSPVRGGGDLENLDFRARQYLQWMQKRGM